MSHIVKDCLMKGIRPCEQCRIYHVIEDTQKHCNECRKEWGFDLFEEKNK